MLRLTDAAVRVNRSERTLWRWQEQGLLRILPGGWVIESELIRADAAMRARPLARRLDRMSARVSRP